MSEFPAPREPGNTERFAPPRDARLVELIEAAHSGSVELHWAAVPIKCVRPFSATFRPVDELWTGAVESLKEQIRDKQYPWMLVYQTGEFFVMSDDYPVYYAYLECDSEYAPCYILGEPRSRFVRGARVASHEELNSILGRAGA